MCRWFLLGTTVNLSGWISLCRNPNFPWCIVFMCLLSVVTSSANFSQDKPQASWWYSPGSPWDSFHFGVAFATCCSSCTKALLSRGLHSTASSYDSLLPSFRNPSVLRLMLLFLWLVPSVMSLNTMTFCGTCKASHTEKMLACGSIPVLSWWTQKEGGKNQVLCYYVILSELF